MKNYVQRGETVTLIAPAAVLSGAGVLVGSIFGVAEYTAGSGDEVEVNLVGVFELPKATGAISQGAKVYWDNTAKNVTTTASGNSLIGAAVSAALSGAATVRVRLNGSTV
jgi:predicted RecA/RadA family phage recombinase